MPPLSDAADTVSIPGLSSWLESPQGQSVVQLETMLLDEAVGDIFGYNALQIGFPQQDFLTNNRIPLRLQLTLGPEDGPCNTIGPFVVSEYTALPFASQSMDLIVLPHVLEFHPDPHQILREIERVLMPEGHLLILGFNPYSLWGIHKFWQQRRHKAQSFPWQGHYLSLLRLKDWLKLLNFEVDRGSLACYGPPVTQEKWLQRWQFMENIGPRWWPFAGGIYLIHAIKRVAGVRLLTPNWQRRSLGAKVLRPKSLRPVARKENHGQ